MKMEIKTRFKLGDKVSYISRYGRNEVGTVARIQICIQESPHAPGTPIASDIYYDVVPIGGPLTETGLSENQLTRSFRRGD